MTNMIIVDDEERIRLGIARFVNKFDLNVRILGSFANGLLAYEYIMNSSEPVHIMITDIKMPGMDGLNLIQQLRKQHPHIKYVIVSGFGEFEYAREAMRFGVVDYLLKPIDMQELDRIIRRINAELSDGQDETETDLSEPLQKQGFRTVELVKHYIEHHYSKEVTLPELAHHVHLTTNHISKLFSKETGETVTDYLTKIRISKAKQLLQFQPEMKVFEVAASVGYPDAAYFNKLFKKMVGKTPKEFKDQIDFPL